MIATDSSVVRDVISTAQSGQPLLSSSDRYRVTGVTTGNTKKGLRRIVKLCTVATTGNDAFTHFNSNDFYYEYDRAPINKPVSDKLDGSFNRVL